MAGGATVPYYWSAENSSGEVDFAYDHANAVIPVEVKAEDNLRARSPRSFTEKYGISRSVRLSLAGVRDQGWVLNLPLFAAAMLSDLDLSERADAGR